MAIEESMNIICDNPYNFLIRYASMRKKNRNCLISIQLERIFSLISIFLSYCRSIFLTNACTVLQDTTCAKLALVLFAVPILSFKTIYENS